ncbi:unnamed protein product, partial [Iphiclides podalirius]
METGVKWKCYISAFRLVSESKKLIGAILRDRPTIHSVPKPCDNQWLSRPGLNPSEPVCRADSSGLVYARSTLPPPPTPFLATSPYFRLLQIR